jgi:hypothetical protein
LWQEADVTDRASLRAAVAATVEQLGGIDVVVANAGIGTYGTIEHVDPEVWTRTIDVNLNGVFHTVQATLPHVLERRGYVLVVASVASLMGLPGMSSYCASKAGVENFVRALRGEVGFRGVAAGAAHPGWIDTDLVREAEQDLASFRKLRANLTWPMNATISVEQCARTIVDGIEKRRARIFVPWSVGLIYWLRSLLNTRVGERISEKMFADVVPVIDREVSELGRAGSARTVQINDLDRQEK